MAGPGNSRTAHGSLELMISGQAIQPYATHQGTSRHASLVHPLVPNIRCYCLSYHHHFRCTVRGIAAWVENCAAKLPSAIYTEGVLLTKPARCDYWLSQRLVPRHLQHRSHRSFSRCIDSADRDFTTRRVRCALRGTTLRCSGDQGMS